MGYFVCIHSMVSIPMRDASPFYPFIPYTSPYPYTLNTPNSPTPISVVPSLVNTHIYLGCLTFSLRDSIKWIQTKLVTYLVMVLTYLESKTMIIMNCLHLLTQMCSLYLELNLHFHAFLILKQISQIFKHVYTQYW